MPGGGRTRTGWLRLRAITSPLLGVTAGLLVGSASAATLPAEGIFENCHLDSQMSTCVQRLQVMHQGGFQIVVIAAGGAPWSLQTYAPSAEALGMSAMWGVGNPPRGAG